MPQPPQFWLVLRELHTPPHSVPPSGHSHRQVTELNIWPPVQAVLLHSPLQQVCPALQALPQRPQLLGSVVTLAQVPLQQCEQQVPLQQPSFKPQQDPVPQPVLNGGQQTPLLQTVRPEQQVVPQPNWPGGQQTPLLQTVGDEQGFKGKQLSTSR
jgi:hypothetical protein